MVLFLSSKNEALNLFTLFCKIVQNKKDYSISNIRSDHGKEFENPGFDAFCGENGISHNFSTYIENVFLVNDLKHNLLSISQLCDKSHKVIFESMCCQVINVNTNKLVFIGHCQGNV